MNVERYAFWRAGTTVILTLSGPQGADNVDPWRMVTDSFGWRLMAPAPRGPRPLPLLPRRLRKGNPGLAGVSLAVEAG